MDTVVLSGMPDGLVTASRATGFIDRFVGLRSRRSLDRIILDVSSIQTFGMKRPLAVVAIDDEMRVMQTRLMSPNRIFWARGASLIVELPAASALPAPGSTIGVGPANE